MVNNAFYQTLNDLTTAFSQGDSTFKIVDYHSFIDMGKRLQDMNAADLANGFLTPLMNKVKVTVNTFRSYNPDLPDMFKGESAMGIVEILSHAFYNARQAPFIGLVDTNDDSMIDFAKPEVTAQYFDKTNSWQVFRSITDTELRGAWTSPFAMDNFIQSLLGAVANSNKLHREVARYNLLNGAMDEVLLYGVKVTTENTFGNQIDLVAVYNSYTAAADQVTVANCLHNPTFVRWAVSYINMFRKWMEKPSTRMNLGGLKTFTPRESQRVKISAVFDSAIRRSLWELYRTEGAMLGDYEVLPFWQNQSGVDSIYTESQGGNVGDKANIVCVVYDDYALGEYLDFESVTNERNNKKLYTTYYYNYVYRYVNNKNANMVLFTLG